MVSFVRNRSLKAAANQASTRYTRSCQWSQMRNRAPETPATLVVRCRVDELRKKGEENSATFGFEDIA